MILVRWRSKVRAFAHLTDLPDAEMRERADPRRDFWNRAANRSTQGFGSAEHWCVLDTSLLTPRHGSLTRPSQLSLTKENVSAFLSYLANNFGAEARDQMREQLGIDEQWEEL